MRLFPSMPHAGRAAAERADHMRKTISLNDAAEAAVLRRALAIDPSPYSPAGIAAMRGRVAHLTREVMLHGAAGA